MYLFSYLFVLLQFFLNAFWTNNIFDVSSDPTF